MYGALVPLDVRLLLAPERTPPPMGGHTPSPWGRVSCLPATRSRSSPSRHGEGQEGGLLAQKSVRLGVGGGSNRGEGWWWLRGGYAAQGREMDEKWGKIGVLSLREGSDGTKWVTSTA